MIIDRKRILIGPPNQRRLYASVGYSRGDAVCRSPIILLSRKETRLIKRTAFGPYLFYMQDGTSIFGLEYTSLCIDTGHYETEFNSYPVFDPDKWDGRGALEIKCSRHVFPGERILCSPRLLVRPRSIRGPVICQNTEIKKSRGRGLGVFACCDFSPYKRILTVPVILASSRNARYIEDTKLIDYVRYWPGGIYLVPLGFWAFHNTTKTYDNTNAGEGDYRERRLTWTYCRQPISKGEEIFIPYIKDSMAGIKLV